MSNNGDEESAAPGLERLRGILRNCAAVARQLDALRQARDAEIQKVCRSGVSERAVASNTGLSPGYVHRAKVHGAGATRKRS